MALLAVGWPEKGYLDENDDGTSCLVGSKPERGCVDP